MVREPSKPRWQGALCLAITLTPLQVLQSTGDQVRSGISDPRRLGDSHNLGLCCLDVLPVHDAHCCGSRCLGESPGLRVTVAGGPRQGRHVWCFDCCGRG